MVARSTVPFSELRRILTTLGFSCGKRGKFWAFVHPESGAEFLFRAYRSHEKVTVADMQFVRLHLDLRGILEKQAFDELLTKATA